MEGFLKEDIGSQGECLYPISGVVRGGEDHDAHGGTRGDGLGMRQEFLAIALGEVEIEQENIGTAQVLGRDELVKKVERMVSILDDLEAIGQLVGSKNPLDGGDVCRIIFDGEDGQWVERCRSLHNRRS